MCASLDKHNVDTRHRIVPAVNLQQIFLLDPNGIVIELIFPAEEGADMPARDNADETE